MVTELALANAQIAFKLVNNNEEIINLDKKHSLIERSKLLLGEKLAQQLTPISFKIPPLTISGLIAKAGFGQATRKNQYVFVNNRSIVDKTIFHAVSQGYHTFLMEKQFPAVLIFIDLPPELVDINVHPTKREVRFREGAMLHDILAKVIKDTLTNKGGLPSIALNEESYSKEQEPSVYSPGPGKPFSVGEASGGYAPALLDAELSAIDIKDKNAEELWKEDAFAGYRGSAKYLQVKNTYIIMQNKEALLIIDQHAAHERVLFDQMIEQFKKQKVQRQRLLIPVTISFSKEYLPLLEENKILFQKLGFDIDEFGADTYAIESYPALLEKVDISSVFENIVSEIAELDLSTDMEKRVTQFLAPIACHGAVRANDQLSSVQINALVESLWRSTAPYTCPHGRPTMIKMAWQELEKKFKRK